MAVYSTKTNRNKSRNNMLRLGWSLISIFSVLLLLVAFNFFNIISIIVLGSIGLLFYPICLFFIFIGIMLVVNKHIKVTKAIILFSIAWLCVFVLIMQMLTSKNIDLTFSEYMRTTFKEHITAGGVLFGAILYPINYLTHKVATYIILTCVLVVLSAFLIDKIRTFVIARNTFAVEDTSSNTMEIQNEINDEVDEEMALESEYVAPVKNDLIDDDVFIEDEEDEEETSRDEALRKLRLRTERTIDDLQKVVEQSEEEEEEIFNTTSVQNPTISQQPQNSKPNIIVHDDDIGFNVNKFVFENKTSDKVVNTKSEEEIKAEERKKAALDFINISKGKFQTKELPKGIDNVKDDKKKISSVQQSPQTSSIQFTPVNSKPTNNTFVTPNNSNIGQNNSTNRFNPPNNIPLTTGFNPADNMVSRPVNNNPNKPLGVVDAGFTKISNLTAQLGSNNQSKDLYDDNLSKKSFEEGMNNGGSQTIDIPDHLKPQGNKFVPEKARKEYTGEANENIVEPTKPTAVQIGINDPIVSKPKEIRIPKPYKRPPIDLLTKYDSQVNVDYDALNQTAEEIVSTLKDFKIDTEVLNIVQGPTFTSFEMKMKPGIPVNTIFSKENDLKMVLRSDKIRLQVPIPGKNAFGIEVPNAKRQMVGLRDIIESPEFQNSSSPLTIALGKDIYNNCKVHKIDKMVHTLVAGGTNSGKSVCLHTMLISLLYKASPDELKLILVDPKRVELGFYNDLPHMLIPKAINDVDKAVAALEWLVKEMERRYTRLQSIYAKNITAYNNSQEVKSGQLEKMYYIVMIFDEVGDFMTQAKKEIEESVKRLAAMARACGIHLILTTQKPNAEVITGTIKTNLPSRIAFAVTANVDSRIILDASGAESLLGMGDMLFLPQGAGTPERMQCAFVNDEEELPNILRYIKENNEAIFDETIEDEMFNKKEGFDPTSGSADDMLDPLIKDAIKLIIKTNRPAAGYVQSFFGIGWPRANKIMTQLEKLGYISTPDAKKNRKIFLSVQEFEEKYGESIDD